MATVAPNRFELVPLSKIRRRNERWDGKTPRLVLVSCGSFSPITNMHLRIFESARDRLETETHQFFVVGGLISPVHDAYRKDALAPAAERLEMCRLATLSSDWIDVAAWEARQERWTRTVVVLSQLHEAVNAALGTSEASRVQLRLLCGSDILDAMVDAKLWDQQLAAELLRRFGVAAIQRQGHDAERVIAAHPMLASNKERISIVPQTVFNNISSTTVREHLRRGLSVRYLVPDAVVDFLEKTQLYRGSRL